MSSTLLPVGPALGVAMAVLVVVAVAVSAAAGLGHGRGVVTAALRAVAQLAAVALVLAAVVEVEPLTVAFVLVMLVTAGRRVLDDLAARRGEVEAALSVGLLPRDAALEIARQQATTALIPVLDQTRTVGLVVLPGAFVGMLIGGADPIQAAAVQLFVLVALLAVEAIAVALTIELVGRGVIVRP